MTAANATPGPLRSPSAGPGVARLDTYDWFVYLCRDAAGEVAYVGRSTEPEKRWAWHRHSAIWPVMIHSRDTEGPYSHDDAKAAELVAIRRHRPGLNVTGNPDYTDLSRADRDARRALALEVIHVRHVEAQTGPERAVALMRQYDEDRLFPRDWPLGLGAAA
jgi:hypothetical protein